jgi:hypothetical protein
MVSEPSKVPSPEDPPSWVIRWRNGLIDWATSTAIVLSIAWIFEKLDTEKNAIAAKSFAAAIKIQNYLDQVISNFDPNQLLRYIFIAVGYLAQGAYLVLYLVLPQNVVDYIFSFQLFQAILHLVGWVLSISLLPLVVLIGTIYDGHATEGILSVACWFVVFLVARRDFKKGDQIDQSFLFPFVEVVLVSYAFLWTVKLTMMGAGWLLGSYIVLCRVCAAGSLIGTSSYWFWSRTTEHSVTETAINWFKSTVLARIT